jgi:hypothetical protein
MIRHAFIACLCIVLLGSCNNIPDHAKYIPKDALVVVGVNTKEIGKKIAWNAIMGSKLMEEMQKQKTGNAVSDPAELGIELMSTSYVYVRPDKRFDGGARITALIPMNSTEKWESFIKKSFPGAEVKQGNKYKSAELAEGMYAGWNNDLLIVMNTLDVQGAYNEAEDVFADATEGDTAVVVHQQPVVNETQLSAEMEKAFSTSKENALTGNKHFSKLEQDAHDITLWINYDALMEQYMGEGMSNMMGISLSNTLWKDAALAAGFDFEKGKITGDIFYYVPDAMKQVAEDLGSTNADKELAERMPAQNLDMLMAWHLAPKGVKGMLEKTGVLGFVNLALSGEGLSIDYILDAFTGDMAIALNDFTLSKKPGEISDTAEGGDNKPYSGAMHYTYALKINKKENFDKLLGLAISEGGLQARDKNSYYWPSGTDTMLLAIEGDHFVISNHAANARGFLQGTFKKMEKPAGAEVVYNQPFGIYFNAQGMMNALDPNISGNPKDAQMLAESKKLLKDVHFKGGDFSSSAFRYQMAINFLDKDENSLLQLMDFAMRMNKAGTEALSARK